MKFFYFLSVLFSSVSIAMPAPKLVVQIVVDQLRGDLLQQYQPEFTSNGFRNLLTHSINFQNTHHPHANTVTCVGHTTIATGSFPTYHGIIANNWWDSVTGKMRYCMEDSTLNGQSSPQLIKASTLSDELILAQKGRAFAVSLKDRGAIPLAGHAGKAFWFDKINGGFTSSSYYYQQIPQWAKNWNTHHRPKPEPWNLCQATNLYHFQHAPTFVNRFPVFGKNFPHTTGKKIDDNYFKLLSMMPKADELTADFAVQLIKNEKLGKTANQTDYLGISFSATDAIGHQFGPNSMESEDNLLQLDKTLAHLLTELDQEVGLDNVLLVLTADHGVSDAPVYTEHYHINSSDNLSNQELAKLTTSFLQQQFSLPAAALKNVSLPYIYLDHKIIQQHHLSLVEVTNELALALALQEKIFQAYSFTSSYDAHDWLAEKIFKMAYPKTRGDIYVVLPPYHRIDVKEAKVEHGSPWRYDSFVPLLFVNPRFTNIKITREVHTTDIAPTLAALLNIKFPSASQGKVLTEVIKQLSANKTI